jgi:arsenical pump membrane protein
VTLTMDHLAIWAVAALAVTGVIARPFRAPEAVWAVLGAAGLLVAGLLPWRAALGAMGKGTDVYLFLTGMMLLSETARREGVFDWIAAFAVNQARGSPRRLFLLIYAVGVVVTAILSNDATAVVLTPAVYAVSRKAAVAPLPYLFICAMIANAASFVLPISNPANLVLYGNHIPPLGRWLGAFALPSLAAIAATFVALRWTEGRRLETACARAVTEPALSAGGWAALAGIGLTGAALLIVSAFDRPLGLPTCMLGVTATVVVLALGRKSPWATVRGVSWSVLPLVAGLFVLVEAVDGTGLTSALAAFLGPTSPAGRGATAAAIAGGVIALGANLINNLPAGLIAAAASSLGHPSREMIDSLLIGVDLGPNLSITGSLATILWLTAIRREGEIVGFWRFLKTGAVVMPPALVLAIATRLLFASAP